jgi:SAM-dependent methyltransferase
MSSVRMGDRLLYMGGADMGLFATLAGRTGLSGIAHCFVSDQAAAARVQHAAHEQGVLVEVTTGDLQAPFPFDAASFDVAIVDASATLPPLDYNEVRRVLRPGGRVVALAGGARRHLMSKPSTPPGLGEDLRQAMSAAFPAARILAERDGWVFVEALKGRE